MYFKERMAHPNPLFLKSDIIKLQDKTKIENCSVLISKSANCKLLPIFNNWWFTFSGSTHNYKISFASRGTL